MNYKGFFSYIAAILITLLLLIFPYLFLEEHPALDSKSLRVLTYSSFIQKWGAGPEIARIFEQETGIKIEWVNAGNAGLLIERLKFKKQTDRPDMVIGFDQFSIHEASKNFEWVDLPELEPSAGDSQIPKGARFPGFQAYDWGPLTFIYKEGQIEPPKSLQDLVLPRFADRLILQDPRMSSPGLQFLIWVINDMGEEQGFEFLEELQASIKVMSPSWSSGYSVFKMEQPSFVFSYFTSQFYHLLEEKDSSYRAAELTNPHPIQVEYFGIPEFCNNCEGSKKLGAFLLRPDIQKILMTRNFMYPVRATAMKDSGFHLPKNVKFYNPVESLTLIKRKRELINKWKKVFY